MLRKRDISMFYCLFVTIQHKVCPVFLWSTISQEMFTSTCVFNANISGDGSRPVIILDLVDVGMTSSFHFDHNRQMQVDYGT